MKNKQNLSGSSRVKKSIHNMISKSKLKWIVLVLLILLIPVSLYSNLFTYEYYYFQCGGKPLELERGYYRIPSDEGYGIHPGSTYSSCLYPPSGTQRDPSTKLGAAIAKRKAAEADRLKRLAAEYDIYLPSGYKTTGMSTIEDGDGLGTIFYVVTNTNHRFDVSEMKSDNYNSYTNLCSKPTEGSRSGTIIGNDSKGRGICRVNPSKYVTDYMVGINIGKTAVMLQASNSSTTSLNAEATAIFSSMEPYSK
jgi:hypothetical protein